MAKFTQTVYRDRRTGKFSKKTTWKRSKAHGGTRYKRERIKHDEKPETEVWIITFKYPAK